MVSSGFRPGGAKGPYVGPAAESPIPTISCTGIGGSPTSYQYDPFDRDLGWFNLTGGTPTSAIVTSGELRPSTNEGVSFVSDILNPAAPTGVQEITLIANFRFKANNTNTQGGAIKLANGILWIGYAGGTDNVVVTQNASPPAGALYSAALGVTNGVTYTYNLKIVATATDAFFYLDSTLIYTLGYALIFGAGSPPKVIVSNSAALPKFAYAQDFALFGYNLPVEC